MTAKVTKEHRLAAARIGDREPLAFAMSNWVESGKSSPDFARNYATVIETAQAIAEAEERGRAAERADTVAYMHQFRAWAGDDRAVISIARIERGDHVSAGTAAADGENAGESGNR